MAVSQRRPRRKVTGKRYVAHKKDKLRDLSRNPTFTRVGEKKFKVLRVRAGKEKVVQLTNDTLNLYDPKTKKYSKVKIKTVVDNPANKNYIRRNILTKGTIVDTDKGKAEIISRPGQEGTLNAVLV